VEEAKMIVSMARVDDFDAFWSVFSTKGAAKRKEHGCKGAQVFRDPDESNHVLVVFDWDEDGFREFLSDPEMQAVFQEGGLDAPPRLAQPAGETDS
jgi:quinol monooxygenase YgiN